MWESRGLCEISKPVWKSVSDFHAGAISTAVRDRAATWPHRGYPDFGPADDRRSCGLQCRRVSDDHLEIADPAVHAALFAAASRSNAAGLILPADECRRFWL
jgi:hypothetical protein